MTWNAQPNRNDVFQNAHTNGYSVNGYQSIPEEWMLHTNGKGITTTASNFGFEIDVGTNKGSSVSVEIPQSYQADSVSEARVTWTYDTRHAPDVPKDLLKIGHGMQTDPTKTEGVYFDATNRQMVFNGDTRPVNVNIDNFDSVGICIVYRYGENTKMEVRTQDKSQVEEANVTASNDPIGVHIQSNGNGDNIALVTNSVSYMWDWQI